MLWEFGFSMWLTAIVLWAITVFQIEKRGRYDLTSQMWLCLAFIWIGFIVMRISH